MAKKYSFEEWFEAFKRYNNNGHVPNRFVTPEGKRLGLWVSGIRLGNIKVTPEQVELLNQYNFVWKIRELRSFEEWFEDFKVYNENGYVLLSFVTPEGKNLGKWVENIRYGQIKLTQEQIELLNQYNFVWKIRESRSFEEWFEDFIKYNKNGKIPPKFKTPEGYSLGWWLWDVRRGKAKITSQQAELLMRYGVEFKPKGIEKINNL